MSAPRLDKSNYVGNNAYFITINCYNRARHFSDGSVVESILSTLHKTMSAFHFRVDAYCFMPDHLHLLLTSDIETSLPDALSRFKQLTGYHFRRQTGIRLWQNSYYDHVIRSEKDFETKYNYLLDNPVRAGLVKTPEEYPFLGSLLMAASGRKAPRYGREKTS